MKAGHLSKTMLVAGIMSIATGGCGSPGSAVTGSGGTTSPGSGSGGEAAGGTDGSGGTTSTGGSATGGTTGSGGSTEPAETGGTTGSGGTTATGGARPTGGAQATGGAVGTGGRGTGGSSTEGTGGAGQAGGTVGAGGASTGGATGPTGGAVTGGRTGTGGRTTSPTGGAAGGGTTGGGTGGTSGSGGGGGGTCTPSKAASQTVTGSGPHKVVIETNSDAGIKCGTIFRPADLGGDEKYPIFVWGEGGCSQNGLSNQAAMGEIASWGYFIVADGTPGGTNACAGSQDGKPFLDYITWAIAENGKSCSAYYQSLDTTKIASDGFSCGGLMSEGISADPRLTAVGITSSGQFSSNTAMYNKMHAPFKVMNGGSSDMAYENGLRDYEAISALGIPSLYFSKSSAGHGGDLNNGKGDFNTVNLAWLNWQLKGDEGATGKGLLIGPSCKFCNASGWDFKSANIQ
jgi:hypothetical protein